MPYKYNTKVFSLKERHPLSKTRFEAASAFLQTQGAPSTEVGEPFKQANWLWDSLRTKKLFLLAL